MALSFRTPSASPSTFRGKRVRPRIGRKCRDRNGRNSLPDEGSDGRSDRDASGTLNQGVALNAAAGTPDLVLNAGGTATYNAQASNPGAGVLVFDYTVGTSDRAPDLQVSVFETKGAVITDTNSNPADLSAVTTFKTGLQVGPAYVASVTSSQTGDVSPGQVVPIVIAMSEAVTDVTTNGSPTLSLSSGATATYDAATSDPSAGTLVFDYMAGANDYTTDLTVLAFNPNGTNIRDANGVAADLSGAAGSDHSRRECGGRDRSGGLPADRRSKRRPEGRAHAHPE